jgi:DNA-binding response OmpR family regulator
LVSALAVGAPGGGRQLKRIFQDRGWRIAWARTRAEVRSFLDSTPVRVVIAECDLPEGGGWRELLADLCARPEPPALVVTSRLADELLWAEVLNMGGYDVLAQPLDSEEVTRVVSAAIRHVDNERLRRWERSPGRLLVAAAS